MTHHVSALLPAVIERRLFKLFKPVLKDYWERTTAHIPKYALESKHVKNARIIPTRQEMLALLPKNGVVAELGVDEGNFSEEIRSITQPKKLHLIDFWGSKRYNQQKRKDVEAKFAQQVKEGSVEINLGMSTEVFDQFPDRYFDWVYIDTTHTYEVLIEELALYSRKVKEGGIMAGHDFIVGYWNGQLRYGVVEAVHEFCVKNDWELIYRTCELHTGPSFAIRKIV